jgi:catechol 2,3-dioxygenase-like lactoylglutathione lyase family enzyme
MLVSRRTFLAGLGATGWSTRQASPPMEFASLDHVEAFVRDVSKTRDFLVRLFGVELKRRDGKKYLRLGDSYLAFEPFGVDKSGYAINQVAISIKRLQIPLLQSFLDVRAIRHWDFPNGRDLGFHDLEGNQIQMSPENGWDFLNSPEFSDETVVSKEAPMFRPLRLTHVVLRVEKFPSAVEFYQRVFGKPVRTASTLAVFAVGNGYIGVRAGARGLGLSEIGILTERVPIDGVRPRLRQLGISSFKNGSTISLYHENLEFRILTDETSVPMIG